MQSIQQSISSERNMILNDVLFSNAKTSTGLLCNPQIHYTMYKIFSKIISTTFLSTRARFHQGSYCLLDGIKIQMPTSLMPRQQMKTWVRKCLCFLNLNIFCLASLALSTFQFLEKTSVSLFIPPVILQSLGLFIPSSAFLNTGTSQLDLFP